MGDLPLRTPTDRRLGGPLPPQPANRTHAHPRASHLATWGCPLVASSGVNPPFGGLSRSRGQVAYALLTRAPVVSGASSLLPLDLHGLGRSLAFILSQDQTLRCMNCFCFYILARCPSFILSVELLERILLCACLFPCIYAFSCCLDQFPQRSLSSSPRSSVREGFSFPKAGAKVRRFSLPAKSFRMFFSTRITMRCVSARKILGGFRNVRMERR